jgi:hypothetical protein
MGAEGLCATHHRIPLQVLHIHKQTHTRQEPSTAIATAEGAGDQSKGTTGTRRHHSHLNATDLTAFKGGAAATRGHAAVACSS